LYKLLRISQEENKALREKVEELEDELEDLRREKRRKTDYPQTETIISKSKASQETQTESILEGVKLEAEELESQLPDSQPLDSEPMSMSLLGNCKL